MDKASARAEEHRLKVILAEIKELTEKAEVAGSAPALAATPEPVAISLEQSAALLNVAPSTLSEYIHSGQLRTFRMGRRVLVRLETLHAFAQSLEETEALLMDAKKNKRQ